MPTRPTPAASKAVQQLSLLIAQCRAGALRPAGGWRTATTVATAAPPPGPCRFVDIGANLLDPMFAGTYHGKQRHAADLDAVLARAADAGVACAIVTAGCLSEARAALAFVRAWRARPADQRARIDLRATVGVHPTRCMEFLPDAAATELQAALDAASAADADGASTASEAVEAAAVAALASPAAAESRARHVSLLREVLADGASDGSVVAIGECGLDYARLHFCPAAVQRAGFAAQLELASSLNLPLFLHCRDAAADFAAACADSPGALGGGGVVHSFDGTSAELGEFLDLGLEIGLNGCSLRTKENLDVAAKVSLPPPPSQPLSSW